MISASKCRRLNKVGRLRLMQAEAYQIDRTRFATLPVVAIDGVIKLAVKSKYVNGISKSTQKKGYLCLESEGKEIHFRNIKIMELLPGVTSPEQSAPVLD